MILKGMEQAGVCLGLVARVGDEAIMKAAK